MQEKRSNGLLWLLGSGLLVLFLVLMGLPRSPDEAASRTEEQDALRAWLACQDYVRQELKAPSTARFAGLSEVRGQRVQTEEGKVRYVISAYVDAQNSFGAMIRTPFLCSVASDGRDRWALETLTFNQ